MPGLPLWRKVAHSFPRALRMASVLMEEILIISTLILESLLSILGNLVNTFNRVCLKTPSALKTRLDFGKPSLLLQSLQLFILFLTIQELLIKCLWLSALLIRCSSILVPILGHMGSRNIINTSMAIKNARIVIMNDLRSNNLAGHAGCALLL